LLTIFKGLMAFAVTFATTALGVNGILQATHHPSSTPVQAAKPAEPPDPYETWLARHHLAGPPAPASTPSAQPGTPESASWEPPAPPPDAGPVYQPSYQPSYQPPAIVVGSTQQALINSDRSGAGLGPLTWSSCLAGIAYQNAVRMANQGAISHSGGAQADLGCGLGRQAGENVGYWSGGINDGQLNAMFMNSAGHRANIMGPYRYVGTAWAVAPNGYAYIAVEFS